MPVRAAVASATTAMRRSPWVSVDAASRGRFLGFGHRRAFHLDAVEGVGEHGAGRARLYVVGFPGAGVGRQRHGDGVGGVAVTAAGEGDVGRGGVAGGDDGVGGVHGAALGGVHRGGVGEGEVGGDVGRGEVQRVGALLVSGRCVI